MICNACKNKTSVERCTSKSLKNLQFCGKHAKSKSPRIWNVVHNTEDKACLIQKIWRGYYVRLRLKLAGEGVLRREKCHNEEELITYETRSQLHPFNYFSFTESGKLYWFDTRTIYQWTIENLKPVNPYTKQEITFEDRKRLKECVHFREHNKLPIFHDTDAFATREKRLAVNWMYVCQVLEENFTIQVDPILFTELNRSQLWAFMHILRNSMLMWARQHSTVESRRNIYYLWVAACWRRQLIEDTSRNNARFYIGATLSRILKDSKMTSDIGFQILSARYGL